MTLGLGQTMPVHHVKCLGCKCELTRQSYWRKPWCKACRKATRQSNARTQKQLSEIKLLRAQARFLRIVLHECGYEAHQYEEFRGDLRKSELAFRKAPETRAARYDLKMHGKQRAM